MSVRVVRWDTGREAEVPEEALRWGPDTRQGTCRAGLLRLPSELDSRNQLSFSLVPYVLPFSGAKWAVRVDIEPHERPLPWYRCSNCGEWCHPFLAHFPCHGDEVPREKLGALLEAAGDALRAEEERPNAGDWIGKGWKPQGLKPVSLRVPFVAPCGGFGDVEVRGWETSKGERFADPADLAAVRRRLREKKGPSLADDIRALEKAEEERPRGRSVPDDTALSLLAECLDECLFPPSGLSRRVRLFLERETAAEIRREWKGTAARG